MHNICYQSGNHLASDLSALCQFYLNYIRFRHTQPDKVTWTSRISTRVSHRNKVISKSPYMPHVHVFHPEREETGGELQYLQVHCNNIRSNGVIHQDFSILNHQKMKTWFWERTEFDNLNETLQKLKTSNGVRRWWLQNKLVVKNTILYTNRKKWNPISEGWLMVKWIIHGIAKIRAMPSPFMGSWLPMRYRFFEQLDLWWDTWFSKNKKRYHLFWKGRKKI